MSEAQSSAEVVELLPSAAYRLRLENEEVVVAHAAGRDEGEFFEIAPGRPGARGAFPARQNARPDYRVVEEVKP